MSYQFGNTLVTDGLVFYADAANGLSYPGSGTTWSDLVGSNDGTLTNGPTFDSGNGGSIAFDGTDDWSSHSSVSTAWPVTMSCWVKFDSFVNQPTFMAESDVSASNQIFGIGHIVDASQDVLRIYNYNVSYLDAKGTTVLSTGQWYHVTGVFESDTSKKLYLNGVLEATLTTSTAIPTGLDTMSLSSFQRGGGFSPGGYLDGNIACAMVYDRALSVDEITQNYNALKNRFV